MPPRDEASSAESVEERGARRAAPIPEHGAADFDGRPGSPRTSPPPGSRAAVASALSSTAGCASWTSTP
eukprot:5059483-Lingulodinium_polyedra.AAC.1